MSKQIQAVQDWRTVPSAESVLEKLCARIWHTFRTVDFRLLFLTKIPKCPFYENVEPDCRQCDYLICICALTCNIHSDL